MGFQGFMILFPRSLCCILAHYCTLAGHIGDAELIILISLLASKLECVQFLKNHFHAMDEK